MKVLVSTKKTHGQRENDFCFVPEGELVYFGSECTNEKTDGRCGCKRSLVGVKCLKGTTTLMVVNMDATEDDLAEAIHRSWVKGGWSESLRDGRARGRAKRMAKKLVAVASRFRAGSVLERRLGLFQRRKPL